MAKMEVDLNGLERELPPIVFRNFPRWRDFLPIAPRTMANMDSRGEGPKERVLCGKVVGYPRAALISWLRERISAID